MKTSGHGVQQRVSRGALMVLMGAGLLAVAPLAWGQAAPAPAATADKAPPSGEKAVPPAVTPSAGPAAPVVGPVMPARPLVNPNAGGLTPTPGAKLVCENRTVKLDPVWRSNESLSFNFKLKNAGTENLQIRAKGG